MIGTCRLVVVVQASKLHYLHPTSLFFGFQLLGNKKFDTRNTFWVCCSVAHVWLDNGHARKELSKGSHGRCLLHTLSRRQRSILRFYKSERWQQPLLLVVLIWGAFKKHDVKGLILKSSLKKKKKKDTQHVEKVLNGSCTLWWLHIWCRDAPVQRDYSNILNAVGRRVCGRGYSKRVGDVTPTTMQEVEPWVTVILGTMTLSTYLSIWMQFYL